jgi:hydrogenase maturation protease
MAARETKILVIGIGNAYRRDDAVGLVIARRLKEEFRDQIQVREESGEGAALMDLWRNANAVILIDAVQTGGTPGMVYRLDARAASIPSRFFRYSTHAFGVAEAVELARALGQIAAHLVIYGIEGDSFDAGTGLTTAVERVVPEVVERIRQEIELLVSHHL